jgi:hypothetical protein
VAVVGPRAGQPVVAAVAAAAQPVAGVAAAPVARARALVAPASAEADG